MTDQDEKPSVTDYTAGFNRLALGLQRMSAETRQLTPNLHRFFDAYQARLAINLAAARKADTPALME